jgi:hypothetical protein
MHYQSLVLLVSSFLFLACSGSDSASANEPPVIDELDVPSTAQKGASGNYELAGTVTVHDDDGTLAQARIEIPGFVAPTLDAHHLKRLDRQAFRIQIDGRAAKGPLDCTFVITDDEGASTSKTVTVTLQ